MNSQEIINELKFILESEGDGGCSHYTIEQVKEFNDFLDNLEKRKKVIYLGLQEIKEDSESLLKKNVESRLYGAANYVNGRLDGIEKIKNILDRTYNCSEENLDEWIDYYEKWSEN